LWNKFESEANVEDSDVGPGFQLTSYIFDDWEEARIEPAMFGNGLFVNHDIGEGWKNDGGNFFAVDLWDVGLTPSRGTIEYWFKFKYDCSFHNSPNFFVTSNELTNHFAGPWPLDNTWLSAGWSGWNLPDRKAYWISWGSADWRRDAQTPVGSAGPGGPLEFAEDSLVHFAWVWDTNGIAGTSDTMRIYVDGNVEGVQSGTWDATDPFAQYLYLGTVPNHGNWDHYYNAVKGVTDNLKIWDYAKTDFVDRFIEGIIPEPTSLMLLLVALGGAVVLARRQ
jgi:hypothetical protein